MKRILITGGNGLVGRAIKDVSSKYPQFEYFFAKHNDYELTNEESVKNLFEDSQPNFVIHTAADVGGLGLNITKPASQFYNNIIMNTFITHYCFLNNVEKLISFSSICAMPDKLNEINENLLHDGTPNPNHFSYGYAKRMVDVQNKAYNKQYGTKFTTLLPVNIYGRNDNFNLQFGHVVPSLIHKCFLAKKDNTPLKIWGDGSAKREFIYSNDIARICLELLEKNDAIPELIIVSDNREISIEKLANIILKHFGYNNLKWQTDKPVGKVSRPTSSIV
ncbi:MAG: NAD-dependent epimerase/dehydratase family protein, partial [Candidatus Neomarinimicrobiota bacterium]